MSLFVFSRTVVQSKDEMAADDARMVCVCAPSRVSPRMKSRVRRAMDFRVRVAWYMATRVKRRVVGSRGKRLCMQVVYDTATCVKRRMRVACHTATRVSESRVTRRRA